MQHVAVSVIEHGIYGSYLYTYGAMHVATYIFLHIHNITKQQIEYYRILIIALLI